MQGIKIAKQGFDAKTPITEANKKNFQLLSTEQSLLQKEISDIPNDTFMFWGYTFIKEVYQWHEGSWQWIPVQRCGSPNRESAWNIDLDKVYIIYHNRV